MFPASRATSVLIAALLLSVASLPVRAKTQPSFLDEHGHFTGSIITAPETSTQGATIHTSAKHR
jgi:hypothetical protein